MNKAPRGGEWLVPYYGTYDRRSGKLYLFCVEGTAEEFLKVMRPLYAWAKRLYEGGDKHDWVVSSAVDGGQAPAAGAQRVSDEACAAGPIGGYLARPGGPDAAIPMDMKEALPGGAGQSLSENL